MKVYNHIEIDAVVLMGIEEGVQTPCEWALPVGHCTCTDCGECPANKAVQTMSREEAIKWWEAQNA